MRASDLAVATMLFDVYRGRSTAVTTERLSCELQNGVRTLLTRGQNRRVETSGIATGCVPNRRQSVRGDSRRRSIDGRRDEEDSKQCRGAGIEQREGHVAALFHSFS